MPMKVYFGGQWTDTNVAESPMKAVVDTRKGDFMYSGLLRMINGRAMDTIQLNVEVGGSLEDMFRDTPFMDYFDGTPHNFEHTLSTRSMFRNSAVERVFGVWNTENVTDMRQMFENSDLEVFEAGALDTSSVTDMRAMFYSCDNLEKVIDLKIYNDANLYSIVPGSMFKFGNPDLELVNVDVENTTTLQGMFHYSRKRAIKPGEIINTHNIKDMRQMFENSDLEVFEAGALDTSSVLDFSGMFYGTNNLKLVEDLSIHNDASLARASANTTSMFGGGNPELKLINVDVGGTTTLRNMFNFTNKEILEAGEIVNSHNIKNVSNMFRQSRLREFRLGALDTSSVVDFSGMFYDAKNLELVDGLVIKNNARVAGSPMSENGMFGMFTKRSGNPDLKLNNVDVEGTNNLIGMFYSGSKKQLGVGEIINSHNVENMSNMFRDSGLETLEVGALDTSSVRNMSNMFRNSELKKLEVGTLDTSNVSNFSGMFYDAKNLELVDGLVIKNNASLAVTPMDINSMFGRGNPDLKLNNVDVEGTNNLTSMFYSGSKKQLGVGEIINSHNVENMSNMFRDSGLETLEVGALDTSSVTDMSYMFAGSNLKILEAGTFDTSSVTNMRGMFESCRNLESVILDDLSNVTLFSGTISSRNPFRRTTSLQHLELHRLGEALQSNSNNRVLDVTDTALDKDGMETLAHSLGVTSVSAPWIMRYDESVVWDTSIATSKNWVVQGVEV